MEHEEPLNRLEEAAQRVADRASYERSNRRGLLWVHAIVGMTAGAQMFAWGSAPNIENILGIWVRVVLALLGTLGGLTLAIGLSSKPRSLRAESVGLVMIGVWDLCIFGGLVAARWKQGDFHLVPVTQPIDPGYVVAYPISVYAGLYALVCVHIWTLWQFVKSGMRL